MATNKPVAVTYHTGGQAEVAATPATGLPKTGQEDLSSTVLSLFGMTSLALAGFVASKSVKKINQKLEASSLEGFLFVFIERGVFTKGFIFKTNLPFIIDKEKLSEIN